MPKGAHTHPRQLTRLATPYIVDPSRNQSDREWVVASGAIRADSTDQEIGNLSSMTFSECAGLARGGCGSHPGSRARQRQQVWSWGDCAPHSDRRLTEVSEMELVVSGLPVVAGWLVSQRLDRRHAATHVD